MIKKKNRIGNKLLLFFLASSFIGGVVTQSYLNIPYFTILPILGLSILGLLIFAFRIKGKLLFTISFGFVTFFLLGMVRVIPSKHISNNEALGERNVVHIQRSQPTYSGRTKYFGYIKSLEQHPGVIIYSKDSLNLKVGSDYKISAGIRVVPSSLNPDEFDYKSYLSQKGISYQCYLKNKQVSFIKRAPDLFDHAVILNQTIRKIFERRLSKDSHAVVDAMFLGDKSYLGSELKSSYINSGTMHILAVSGLHVGILYYILLFIVTKGNTRRTLSPYQAAAIILFIWSYAILSGLPTSVVRAGIMFTFLLVGKSLNRSNNTYNSISLAAIIILLVNPTELFTVSFQLSFIAVLSIISLYPIIEGAWTPKNKIINYCWQIIAVSLAAQLGVLGLSIFYFHTFPSYFLIANLFAIPLSGLVLVLSLAALTFSSIPLLSDAIFLILDKVVFILNLGLSFISNLPGSSIDWLHLSVASIFLLSLTNLLFFQFIRTKKRSVLHASMGSLLLVTICIFSERFSTRLQTEFWIYQTPGATTIGMLEHKHNYLFGIDLDSNHIRYHLRDHWIKTYRNKPLRDFPNLLRVGQNHIGKIDDQYYAIATDVNALSEIPLDFAFIVYTNNCLKRSKPLENCDLNILDGSNSYYLCTELQEKYSTDKNFHFTPLEGAKNITLRFPD